MTMNINNIYLTTMYITCKRSGENCKKQFIIKTHVISPNLSRSFLGEIFQGNFAIYSKNEQWKLLRY
jgi:hypothetical protein